MKNPFPKPRVLCFLLTLGLAQGCASDEGEESNGGERPSATGIWNRFGSEYGYQTDVAYGGIQGESADRVYMCELPGSPTAGLYKGRLVSPSLIRWDAVHGLPDYEVVFLEGGTMTFLPQNGTGTFVGKYQKGTWTPGACNFALKDGQLADSAKKAYVHYQRIEGFRVGSVKIAGVSVPLLSEESTNCASSATIPVPAGGGHTLPVSITYTAVGVDGTYTHTVSSQLLASDFTQECNRLVLEWGCGALEACVYVQNR